MTVRRTAAATFAHVPFRGTRLTLSRPHGRIPRLEVFP